MVENLTDSKFYRIRERTAKRVVGIVAIVILATSLGFWVGQTFAYDSTSRTVYGENITNLQSLGTSANPLSNIFTNEASIENLSDNINAQGYSLENIGSVNTEQASIGESDFPFYESTDKDIRASVIADDGTYYALNWNGSAFELLESSDPSGGWTVQHTGFGHSDDLNLSLHITSNGTLLTGLGGQIQRSTDEGQTWTDVQSINGPVWSFSENSGGSILASEYSGRVQIWESTDDGQNWSTFADGTDLTEFSEHVHKVAYHRQNDWIIVAGGDGDDGYYRSTDGGDSWDFLSFRGVTVNTQAVGICPHPTDGNVYFLGEDAASNSAIWKITDDGTGIQDAELVLGFNEGTRCYVWDISCIQHPDGDFYVAAGTRDLSPNLLVMSRSKAGRNWKIISPIDKSFHNSLKGQGPYEYYFSASYLPTYSKLVYLNRARNYNRGVSVQSRPIDTRKVTSDIEMDGFKLINRSGAIDWNDAYNNFIIRNYASGGRLDFWQDGNRPLRISGDTLNLDGVGKLTGAVYMMADEQDLSTLSLGAGEDGHLYYHNGASTINANGGTTDLEGWYMWDNSASEFKSVVQH